MHKTAKKNAAKQLYDPVSDDYVPVSPTYSSAGSASDDDSDDSPASPRVDANGAPRTKALKWGWAFIKWLLYLPPRPRAETAAARCRSQRVLSSSRQTQTGVQDWTFIDLVTLELERLKLFEKFNANSGITIEDSAFSIELASALHKLFLLCGIFHPCSDNSPTSAAKRYSNCIRTCMQAFCFK